MTSVLALALPCSKCKAAPGAVCVRQDGAPASRSHMNRTPLQPCGSFGGYQRHVKSGETPCDPCRDANRRYHSEYRDRRPDLREADIAGLRARREATRLLIERHRAEFRELLTHVTSTADTG